MFLVRTIEGRSQLASAVDRLTLVEVVGQTEEFITGYLILHSIKPFDNFAKTITSLGLVSFVTEVLGSFVSKV